MRMRLAALLVAIFVLIGNGDSASPQSTTAAASAGATSQPGLGNLVPDVTLLALRSLNVSYDEVWPPPPLLSFTLHYYSVTDVRYDDKFVYVLLARMYQSTDSLRWCRCVLKAERGKPPKKVQRGPFLMTDPTPEVFVIGIDDIPDGATSGSTNLVMLCQMYFETIPRIGGPSRIRGLLVKEDGITILGDGNRTPTGSTLGHITADLKIASDYSTAKLIEHSVYIP